MTGRVVFGKFGRKDRYYLDGKEVTKRQFDAAFPAQPIAEDGECALSSVPHYGFRGDGRPHQEHRSTPRTGE